jgi:hypothetical protein
MGTLDGMRETGFDPLRLTADASLNRVVIGDVGCPEIAGMMAGQACSRDALCALAAGCGLAGLQPDRLSDAIASALAFPATPAGRAAAATLVLFGRRLGALIATLRDPVTPGEQGYTPARHACLSYWLRVDSVWLGGGLLAGACGPAILAAAQAGSAAAQASSAAAQAGSAAAVRPCRLALTPHPAVAPLLGAALHAPATSDQDVLVVADLGHTSIKTAIAERNTTALTGLRLLGTCAAPAGGPAPQIHYAVADALTRAVQHAAQGHPRRVHIIASVASYLRDGAPADDGRGMYGSLAGRMAWLRGRIEETTGTDATVEFIHDGTAAAATARSVNSATITAGTRLGTGFRPPNAPPLLNLAPDLQISPW